MEKRRLTTKGIKKLKGMVGITAAGLTDEEIKEACKVTYEPGDIVQHRASKQQAVIVSYKPGGKYEITTGFDELTICSEIVLEKVEPEIEKVFYECLDCGYRIRDKKLKCCPNCGPRYRLTEKK